MPRPLRSNTNNNGPGLVGALFCQECNNMLYPREDEKNKKLVYACRNCDFRQLATRSCVYVNNIKLEFDEFRYITTEVLSDPTLGRTEDNPCPKCKGREAAFFHGQTKRGDQEMMLYHVCTNQHCGHIWIQYGKNHL